MYTQEYFNNLVKYSNACAFVYGII